MNQSVRLLTVLFLLHLACSALFAEEAAELPRWDPYNWASVSAYETTGDAYETTRMRISQITRSPKLDPSLPDVFGGKKIALREREIDVIAKLDALPHLVRAAEPVHWSKDIRHSADDRTKSYRYSLHHYIFKDNPKTCMQLFFNNDGEGLEHFCLIEREIPFTVGEDFFLYPNVYPVDDWIINDWKTDIADWNALSEYERYFCMLSVPLIAYHPRNPLKVFSVNPEPTLRAPNLVKESQVILEQDWSCRSRSDVLDLFESFRNGSGHAALYDRILQLSLKHRGKTAEEISTLECLDIHDTTLLTYVMQMGKKLGEHGILAWDKGRLLGVLRWSIATGWMSEQEAMQYARPIIDELLDSYASWEDYLAHYVIGRGFFALSECDYTHTRQYQALNYSLNYARNYEQVDKEHQLSFHGMQFPAKKQGGNPVLTYNDAWYIPTADAKPWEEINVISKKDLRSLKSEQTSMLLNFCIKKKEIPCIALLNIKYNEAQGHTPKENECHYDAATIAFKKISPEKRGIKSSCKMYIDFYESYIMNKLAVQNYRWLYYELFELDNENTTDEKMCFLYAACYLDKMKNARTKKKFTQYRQQALEFLCRMNGSPIPSDDAAANQLLDRLEKSLKALERPERLQHKDILDFNDIMYFSS